MASWRFTVGIARSLVTYWRPFRQGGLRRLYQPFIKPGDRVFDIGAHLGDRSVAFSDLGASVIALEPQPQVLPWLRRLVGRRDVTVVPEAVGAQVGELDLAISERNPTVSTLASHWRQGIGAANETFRHVRWERRVTVPVTTLDALIARYGEPVFCKIDVEGFELSVLQGLSTPVRALSVEFVAGTLADTQACVRHLGTLGDYEYNAVFGEQRRWVFPQWQSADAVTNWLERGAGGASSGDIYARLRH